MPSPLKWLFDAVRSVYRALRGEKEEATVRVAAKLRDTFHSGVRGSGLVDNLAGDLFLEKITVQQWTLEMRETVKQSYIAQYLAARGGRENMTQEDWGRLGGLLKSQYQYLNGFAEDLAAGKMSEAQARVRANMYLDSAGQAFERAKAIGAGIPYDQIPQWPRDGRTQCRTNCQCEWTFKEDEDRWEATWELGPAEHCDDCVANAAKWNPLMIMK